MEVVAGVNPRLVFSRPPGPRAGSGWPTTRCTRRPRLERGARTLVAPPSHHSSGAQLDALQQQQQQRSYLRAVPLQTPQVFQWAACSLANRPRGGSGWQLHAAQPPQPQTVTGSVEDDDGIVEDDKGFFHNITKPLRDFGFGRSALLEGGVGLFMLAGVGLLFALYSWIRGSIVGKAFTGYQAVIEFPQACGITVGTPVRIRGVPVGSVMNVRPSLQCVDVLVEVRDQATVIPRNSVIEANQSGLIAEPLIDVTPQLPVPDYKAGPLDPECESEGRILCNKGRIKGEPGVSLDDMVYICTKLARQMDEQGLDSMFETAKTAATLMQDARPLLEKAVQLASEVLPLMKEIRQGDLVANLDSLTATASEAARDIHTLQNEVLTKENVDALRQSVQTLTKTLQHIENISGSVGTVATDSAVQKNMKQLIEALSRMVAD